MANFLSYASTALDLCRYASPAPKKSIEDVNLEGFTSALRIAMFPYAPGIKISVEEFAINFEFPYKLAGVDAKSITRYFAGEGRKNFVLVKRIARIMLDLFPPIPKEDGKEVALITNIYSHIIYGLEHIKLNFFPEQPFIEKVPNPKTFDFDFNFKKHTEITDLMAGEAIQKTINLFKYCCVNKIEPKKDLTPLQIDVKNAYNKLFLVQFSNGLDLLAFTQGKTPVKAEWLVEHEFHSLDRLVQGRIALYQKFVVNSGKMIPFKKEDTLFDSGKLDDQNSTPSLSQGDGSAVGEKNKGNVKEADQKPRDDLQGKEKVKEADQKPRDDLQGKEKVKEADQKPRDDLQPNEKKDNPLSFSEQFVMDEYQPDKY